MVRRMAPFQHVTADEVYACRAKYVQLLTAAWFVDGGLNNRL
jgi:hypothetical protein